MKIKLDDSNKYNPTIELIKSYSVCILMFCEPASVRKLT